MQAFVEESKSILDEGAWRCIAQLQPEKRKAMNVDPVFFFQKTALSHPASQNGALS